MRELENLEIYDPENGTIRVQPCHSPVWDTAISTLALATDEKYRALPALDKAKRWLLSKEVRVAGDWKMKNPAVSRCPHCNQSKLAHRVCPNCGYYAGREVVKPKVEEGK